MESIPREVAGSPDEPAGGAENPTMILVCDHRGAGLEKVVKPLDGADFEVVVSRSARETRLRMRNRNPSLVVIDPLSPGGTVELEEIERLRRAGGSVPVLLVCDPRSPTSSLEAARILGQRAWDLIYRNAPIEEYVLRVERLLSQVESLDELEEMRYRAAHDDRTELLRPRFFTARLHEHFSAAKRHDLDLALVIGDLDNFGQVNKVFDHTVGDEVITRVGRAIRSTLRQEDIADRLGGDEFGVVLPYATPVDTARAVNRLRDVIAALSGKIGEGGRFVPVSMSLGFETLHGQEFEAVDTLRQHAELALRHAKRSGGNRGIYYRSLGRR